MKTKMMVLSTLALASLSATAGEYLSPEIVCQSERAAADENIRVELLSRSTQWKKFLNVTAQRLDGEKLLAYEEVPLTPKITVDTLPSRLGGKTREVVYENAKVKFQLTELSSDGGKTWVIKGHAYLRLASTAPDREATTLNCRAMPTFKSEKEDVIFGVMLAAQPGTRLTDDRLVKEIAKLEGRGLKATGHFDAMSIGSSCGFAGCHGPYLVGMDFSTRGTNPRSQTLFMVVQSHPTDGVKILRFVDVK